jgi:hypothetical protein
LEQLIKAKRLRPDGGHVTMGITNKEGKILHEVSLRPSKTLINNGRLVLHPNIYPDNNLLGNLSFGRQSSILEEEIDRFVRKMISGPHIETEFTVIPLQNLSISYQQLLENINSARSIKLYNLCSLAVRDQDLKQLKKLEISEFIENLKTLAKNTGLLDNCQLTHTDEVILAAMACTHAIITAATGNSHQMDQDIGPDQPTQTAVVYSVIQLTGAQNFYSFAEKIGLLDQSARLTKR